MPLARIHFPGLATTLLDTLPTKLGCHRTIFRLWKPIARRARFLASKRGGVVRRADVETAVSEVLAYRPISASQAADGAQVELQKAITRVTSPAAGRLVNEPLMPVSRGSQPAGMDHDPKAAFGSRALRAGVTERGETELVQVEA